jgi:hypothetical protein
MGGRGAESPLSAFSPTAADGKTLIMMTKLRPTRIRLSTPPLRTLCDRVIHNPSKGPAACHRCAHTVAPGHTPHTASASDGVVARNVRRADR